jgi:extradiol dioxygenase family protein
MAVQLNHTIVHAHDKHTSAMFLAEILGLPLPRAYGPFLLVQAGNDVTLDFMDVPGEITVQHYAFLVDERDFDEIHGRIRERAVVYWADPFHRDVGEINTWDGGRGLYFADPSGHNMEIMTRPYVVD